LDCGRVFIQQRSQRIGIATKTLRNTVTKRRILQMLLRKNVLLLSIQGWSGWGNTFASIRTMQETTIAEFRLFVTIQHVRRAEMVRKEPADFLRETQESGPSPECKDIRAAKFPREN